MVISTYAAPGLPCDTILTMNQFARFGVHLLETLFFSGLLGSLAVVLISSVGDVQDLFLRRHDRADQRDQQA